MFWRLYLWPKNILTSSGTPVSPRLNLFKPRHIIRLETLRVHYQTVPKLHSFPSEGLEIENSRTIKIHIVIGSTTIGKREEPSKVLAAKLHETGDWIRPSSNKPFLRFFMLHARCFRHRYTYRMANLLSLSLPTLERPAFKNYAFLWSTTSESFTVGTVLLLASCAWLRLGWLESSKKGLIFWLEARGKVWATERSCWKAWAFEV